MAFRKRKSCQDCEAIQKLTEWLCDKLNFSMTGILGISELLEATEQDPGRKNDLKTIVTLTRQCAQTLDKLNDFSDRLPVYADGSETMRKMKKVLFAEEDHWPSRREILAQYYIMAE